MAHYKNNIPVLFDIYDEAEHIHEDRTVFDGCIDMGGLPDSYLGVSVTCNGQHFHEIYENRTPGSLEFRIDYKHGWLYLNPTIYNGKKITLDYYSRGIELTPASRIYTFDQNGCVNIERTLQDYIDEVNGGCKFTEASVPSTVDAFENIKSSDSFSTMFGKIARWFTELKAHLKGTKWRHKAEHVDCKDNKTVQTKIDELFTNKADRGTVTSIEDADTKVEAGIYDCGEGGDLEVSYRLESNGEEAGTCKIITLIVSRYESSQITKQLGVGWDSKNGNKFILIYRTKYTDNSEWSSWNRIDGDLASAIGTLSELQTINKTDLVSAINSEVTARKKADEDMQGIIDEIDSTLDSHISGEMYNHSAGEILYENPEYSDALGAKQALDELFANKAAKGFVTKDTIDSTIEPGIYGTEEDMTVRYTYDYDETGKSNNDGWLLILFVSSDRPGNVTQFAIVDNDSGYKFRGVQRTKTKGGQWTKWHTLYDGSGNNDGGDPFVMYGKYDLTKYPRGITCMDEAAADNASWTLDYTIPPISITNSVLGTVELKAQDEVYDGLTESDKGKTFSAFAEYKKDENYARAKIIIDESPMRKKDYAILKSSKELSLIRLYLGDFTVNEIHIGGGVGPDGTRPEESSADISFTYPKNNNPEIYILNYVFLTDDRGNFKNGRNGFNAGDQSDASDGGGAIGRLAKTTSGGAVGSEAESNNGFAGGYHAKVGGMGAAIGANASAYHGGAAGSGAQAGNGFAGGINAKCGKAPNGEDVDCIQLGTGTNGNEKTLKVYDYQLTALDSQGKQHLSDVGDISKLKTADKTDIVSAINEIKGEVSKSQISIYPNMGGGFYIPKPIQTSGQFDSDGNGGYTWNVALYNDILNYPITVSDPIFGKFDIGIPPKNGFSGLGVEWEGTLSQLQLDTDVRLYVKCNVQHDTKTNTITPMSWENVTIHSGSNINFIEMKNGNTINANKPSYTADEVGAIATNARGANGGVAELDDTGKVPLSRLPSTVSTDLLSQGTNTLIINCGNASF